MKNLLQLEIKNGKVLLKIWQKIQYIQLRGGIEFKKK